MGMRQLKDSPEKTPGGVTIAAADLPRTCEPFGNFLLIDLDRNLGVLKDLQNIGGESERLPVEVIIEGANAKRVTTAKELLFGFIPQGKGIITNDPLQTLGTPHLVRRHQEVNISGGV